MTHTYIVSALQRAVTALLVALVFTFGWANAASAHPLGNFTINHFARVEVGTERVNIHYVVDMAEIPTFQTLQATDINGDGSSSEAELSTYLEHVAAQYADGILLAVNSDRIPLQSVPKAITMPPGVGGLPTLRVECDFTGVLPVNSTDTAGRLRFEDTNNQNRIGWHELVVASVSGVKIFDSSAFGSAVTDELKAYPADLLTAPLTEREAELSFTSHDLPANATALLTRDGRSAVRSRDRLAELIAVPELTPTIALLSLLIATVLGSLHAFSPGHGKTIVGAYLVGAKATPLHAAFLGLIVTITHTIGVFALGLVTLFASQYIVPDRLFPILSFISGGIVLAIGSSLFIQRLRQAIDHFEDRVSHDHPPHVHSHDHPPHVHSHDHSHDRSAESHTHRSHHHTHAHDHSHQHTHATSPPHPLTPSLTASHSHGGHSHSHLPPGVDGSQVTWNSLLALGISGGLLPCPSALVVFLAAVSLHRIGFGLLLVLAFSLGLAGTLTGIGLVFVYAGRFMQRQLKHQKIDSIRFLRALPVVSALAIACVGAGICYGAVRGATGML